MRINVYICQSMNSTLLSSISSNITVHPYQELSEICAKILKGANNIFFLNLKDSVNEMSAIEVAHKIKQDNPNSQIIFVSDPQDYTNDIYNVEHCYFSPSDSIEENLTTALLKAIRNLSKQTLVIQQGKSIARIPITNIKYIERKGLERKTYIYTRSNHKYICDSKLPDIIEHLSQNQFVCCHTSYIVPIQDIRELNSYQITLADDTVVPVSRSHYHNVEAVIAHA